MIWALFPVPSSSTTFDCRFCIRLSDYIDRPLNRRTNHGTIRFFPPKPLESLLSGRSNTFQILHSFQSLHSLLVHRNTKPPHFPPHTLASPTHTHTLISLQATAARSSRLYNTKGSSSGNLGAPGALGAADPSRGSTPPTPGTTLFPIISVSVSLGWI